MKTFIDYLPEKWVVEWKEEDCPVRHKEYFFDKEEALLFRKNLEYGPGLEKTNK